MDNQCLSLVFFRFFSDCKLNMAWLKYSFLFAFLTVAKMHSIIEEKLYPYTQDIIKVGTNTHCALHSDISRVYPY